MGINISQKFGVPTYRRKSYRDNGKTVVKVDETLVIDGSEVGTNDYNAFPSMAIDATRDYCLYCAYRRGSDHNTTKNGDLVVIKSTNGGYTWSEAIVAVGHADRLITNPSIAALSTGRIILFFDIESSEAPFRIVYYVYSDDGGTTWSSEVSLTTDYSTGQISGPGEAIEVGGVVYKAFYATTSTSGSREGCIYYKSIIDDFSVDNSFTKASTLIYSIENFNGEEPTLLRLNDNSWIALIRSDPDVKTYIAWSPDKGTTWSRHRSAITSIGKNPLAISPNGTIVSFGRMGDGADVSHSTQRTILSYSSNQGKTFVTDFIDSRTGHYLYGGIVWHPVMQQFIGIWSVETSTTFTGPCDIICARFDEV